MQPISRRIFIIGSLSAGVTAACRSGAPQSTPTPFPVPTTPTTQPTPTLRPPKLALTPAPSATPLQPATVTEPAQVTDPVPTTAAEPTARPQPTQAGVSLRVAIGQMIMAGFRGTAVDETHLIVQDIRDQHLGAVVLFGYDTKNAAPINIESSAQLKALTAALREVDPALMIATDQEGGRVARLSPRTGFAATKSHAELGAANDPAATFTQAESMAAALQAHGINLNLAPVVDLNTNPNNPIIATFERSFAADPAVVFTHAKQFIDAHHAHNVGCTLKHFPGHGSSRTDSHLGFVDVSDTWVESELEPFRRLIDSNAVDAIMTAHIFNRTLDGRFPATLSAATLTDLLRGKLGYNGVIISDDMLMGAIAQHYGFEEAITLAVNAGVDILALSNNTQQEDGTTRVQRTVNVILDAVNNAIIPEDRIWQSYERIQRLKRTIIIA